MNCRPVEVASPEVPGPESCGFVVIHIACQPGEVELPTKETMGQVVDVPFHLDHAADFHRFVRTSSANDCEVQFDAGGSESYGAEDVKSRVARFERGEDFATSSRKCFLFKRRPGVSSSTTASLNQLGQVRLLPIEADRYPVAIQ